MSTESTPKKAIIISVSSDTGVALCSRWIDRGWNVAGTYRTKSKEVRKLEEKGLYSVYCDLEQSCSVQQACEELGKLGDFDVLVSAPGNISPVGPFLDCSFDEWERSIGVNFTAQLRIVHALAPFRSKNKNSLPCFLFFAGGGTNNATVNYSAYTVSKISLIKMCELLDAEIDDARFVILGPGWVNTKIHKATLDAGQEVAGANYQKTLDKLSSDECTPMESVLDCCDWVINTPRQVVSGRNFSVVYDLWGDPELNNHLLNDQDMYKLRRNGNESYSISG